MDKIVRTTVRLDSKLHKKIRMFCLENDISLNDFCINAMIYAVENKILPEEKE